MGVFCDGTKLFVADTYNSRVLIFNSIPNTSGIASNFVVGQADAIQNSSNRSGSPAANTLSFPQGVFSDGTKLYVADTKNHRVLIWNAIPTSNGEAANSVLGQPDLISNLINNGGLSSTSLNNPTGVFVHSGKIYVVDQNNFRVVSKVFP
ncbi:MAG: hypothetical protein NT027_03700 [Proteobacteria bacterium]|nr:hypothetical protein [Pseudomonadota bacterium]